jgi:hypothetical protein
MTQNETEVRVNSWKDFIALTLGYQIGHPRRVGHFFRGQADARWGLVPSLVRQVETQHLDAAHALEIELSAIIEFQKAAGLYLPQTLNLPENDLATWWTYMQHHGVPTRLLDWTTSPFVAAYFAVEREGEDPDGAVWIINFALIEESLRLHHPNFMPRPEGNLHGPDWNNPNVVLSLFRDPQAEATLTSATPSRQTDRMIAQQTVSMMSPQILAKHDAIIDKAVPAEQRAAACKKLIISSDCETEFMRQLRRMNITGATLFPGIDGFGRSVRELIALDCRG